MEFIKYVPRTCLPPEGSSVLCFNCNIWCIHDPRSLFKYSFFQGYNSITLGLSDSHGLIGCYNCLLISPETLLDSSTSLHWVSKTFSKRSRIFWDRYDMAAGRAAILIGGGYRRSRWLGQPMFVIIASSVSFVHYIIKIHEFHKIITILNLSQ